MILADYITNPWVVLALKLALILGFYLLAPMVVGYTEHKTLAHMQARLGPMEAGRFHGWAQLIADGVKFVQKEDIVTRSADRWVFSLAPGIALVPPMLVLVVIPFGPNGFFIENLSLGLFYALAVGSVAVIGVLTAGWASANKFSLMGSIRAGGQLIAYELPLVFAAAAIAIQAGTLSLVGIVEAQAGMWFVLPQFVGFLIFFIAGLAEMSRHPFDIPVADSELVYGFKTEYTGVKFAFLLLAEYGHIVVISALAATIYLGGWHGVIVPWIPGPIWMLLKIGALAFVVIWARATFPRFREDQLQKFAWKVLIPIAFVNILVTGFVKAVVSS